MKKEYNMFNVLIISTVFVLSLFNSCSKSENLDKELSFDEKEIIFLHNYRYKILGDWKVKKMIIAKDGVFNPTKSNANDTTILDYGTISISQIGQDFTNPEKYNELNANFYVNDKIIPFISKLYAYSSKQTIYFDAVSGLIELNNSYSQPLINVDFLSDEYKFLDKYFLSDNYAMILSEDGKIWTWTGFNRYIREMVLVKIY